MSIYGAPTNAVNQPGFLEEQQRRTYPSPLYYGRGPQEWWTSNGRLGFPGQTLNALAVTNEAGGRATQELSPFGGAAPGMPYQNNPSNARMGSMLDALTSMFSKEGRGQQFGNTGVNLYPQAANIKQSSMGGLALQEPDRLNKLLQILLQSYAQMYGGVGNYYSEEGAARAAKYQRQGAKQGALAGASPLGIFFS